MTPIDYACKYRMSYFLSIILHPFLRLNAFQIQEYLEIWKIGENAEHEQRPKHIYNV